MGLNKHTFQVDKEKQSIFWFSLEVILCDSAKKDFQKYAFNDTAGIFQPF